MSTPVLTPGPPAKRKKSKDGGDDSICILCNEQCNEVRSFNDTKWKIFKNTAMQWKELDKYGGVYDGIDWEKGPIHEQWIFHREFVTYMQISAKLIQAKNRLERRLANDENSPTLSSPEPLPPSPPMMLPPASKPSRNETTQPEISEQLSSPPRRPTRMTIGRFVYGAWDPMNDSKKGERRKGILSDPHWFRERMILSKVQTTKKVIPMKKIRYMNITTDALCYVFLYFAIFSSTIWYTYSPFCKQ